MPDAVRQWHARADELFHRAETMHDADARMKIREIAANYVRLAERVETEVLRQRARAR
jgi:hypothetical protein